MRMGFGLGGGAGYVAIWTLTRDVADFLAEQERHFGMHVTGAVA